MRFRANNKRNFSKKRSHQNCFQQYSINLTIFSALTLNFLNVFLNPTRPFMIALLVSEAEIANLGSNPSSQVASSK